MPCDASMEELRASGVLQSLWRRAFGGVIRGETGAGSMKLSFVIPLHNERETLVPLAEGIAAHVGEHDYRILFVDDGSSDGSDAVLSALAAANPRVGYVRFRRNLGKTAALSAGFACADGELVFTMDADLQDDPSEIPRFLEKLDEGYDLVTGWKKVRHDAWHKVLASRVYNGVIARLFSLDLHDVNCGFKAMRREVVERLQLYGDLHRLIPVLASNLGYRVAEIPVQHHPRRYGQSKYGFERFFRGALDTFSVWFLHRYSRSPGHLFALVGCMLGIAGGLGSVAGIVTLAVCAHPFVALILILAGGLCLQAGLGAIGLALFGELILRHVARSNVESYVAERVPPSEV